MNFLTVHRPLKLPGSKRPGTPFGCSLGDVASHFTPLPATFRPFLRQRTEEGMPPPPSRSALPSSIGAREGEAEAYLLLGLSPPRLMILSRPPDEDVHSYFHPLPPPPALFLRGASTGDDSDPYIREE